MPGCDGHMCSRCGFIVTLLRRLSGKFHGVSINLLSIFVAAAFNEACCLLRQIAIAFDLFAHVF